MHYAAPWSKPSATEDQRARRFRIVMAEKDRGDIQGVDRIHREEP
jgi:hypothetical protein